ncbi:MAG TPA: hypothetical protein VKT51_02035 [Candidatus Eremiobacteraceae bacterium]|nr:hypothetical protein [Candidatus Eremiobacteraceae bacterium]
MRASGAAPAAALGFILTAAIAAFGGQIFLPGHEYGTGEQQVYAIARDARLTVRFARADGTIGTQTSLLHDASSVAFTVEGFTGDGAPVLAVATAGALRQSSVAAVPSDSPVIAADGSAARPEFDGFAPASLVLSGLDASSLDIGTEWHGTGDLALPFAHARAQLHGKANFKSGTLADTLLQAVLNGGASIAGQPRLSKFGAVRLTGGGALSGEAYFQPARHLLVGTDLSLTSNGNAVDAHGTHGSYSLTAHWIVKLVGLVAGTPPIPGISPGIGIPANQMGERANAANVYSPGSPVPVLHPAPMPSGVISGNSGATPTPYAAVTPSPTESLAPLPIGLSSDQPIASPPPAPTPTQS